MRLGTTLPQFGNTLDEADRIGEFAEMAEDAGVDSLWVGDRLLAAVDPQIGYGGTDTVPEEFRRALDPFALLAVAAARTTSTTLGTSVLVGPLYPPAVLARSLGTIGAVSRGRLIAGMGIGWSPEEYAGAGLGFDHRGARLDELLDGLDTLWSGTPAPLTGPRFPLPAVHVDTPRRRPAVYLSGWSEAALRRVGRRGDGWLPVARLPSGDLDGQIEGLLRLRATIDDAARTAGPRPGAHPHRGAGQRGGRGRCRRDRRRRPAPRRPHGVHPPVRRPDVRRTRPRAGARPDPRGAAPDELMINGEFARVEAANRPFAATPSARRASPRTRSGGRPTARRPGAA